VLRNAFFGAARDHVERDGLVALRDGDERRGFDMAGLRDPKSFGSGIRRRVLETYGDKSVTWRPYREISDAEWERVKELVPELRPRENARGRKGVDARAVLNGALWVFANNEPWAALPICFPSYQTCHRRWKIWLDTGAFEHMIKMLYGGAARELMATVQSRVLGNEVTQPARRRHAGY
jgi:transposase